MSHLILSSSRVLDSAIHAFAYELGVGMNVPTLPVREAKKQTTTAQDIDKVIVPWLLNQHFYYYTAPVAFKFFFLSYDSAQLLQAGIIHMFSRSTVSELWRMEVK